MSVRVHSKALLWVVGAVSVLGLSLTLAPTNEPDPSKWDALFVATSRGPYCRTELEDEVAPFSREVETLIGEVSSIAGILPTVMNKLVDASQIEEFVLIELLNRIQSTAPLDQRDISIFGDLIERTALGNIVRIASVMGRRPVANEDAMQSLLRDVSNERRSIVLEGLARWERPLGFLHQMVSDELEAALRSRPMEVWGPFLQQSAVGSLLRALCYAGTGERGLGLSRQALQLGYVNAVAPLARWGSDADLNLVRAVLRGESAVAVASVLGLIRELPKSIAGEVQRWIDSSDPRRQIAATVLARRRLDVPGWRRVVRTALTSSIALRRVALTSILASNPRPDSEWAKAVHKVAQSDPDKSVRAMAVRVQRKMRRE